MGKYLKKLKNMAARMMPGKKKRNAENHDKALADSLSKDDFVDLGLPSGLLWASRNVGAATPFEGGSLFAWAETAPKEEYSWASYRYAADGEGRLTKYCFDPSEGHDGFSDNLCLCQPDDDAATANGGGRMPTQDEWQELMDHTSASFVIFNGTKGLLLESYNGKSIFLPAMGNCWGPDQNSGDVYGYYWSASLSKGSPQRAWYCYFGRYGFYGWGAGRRFGGLSVRAVRPSER